MKQATLIGLSLLLLARLFETAAWSAEASIAGNIYPGMPLPPPPAESKEASSATFHFDKHKSLAENATTRTAIEQKLRSWQSKLMGFDLKYLGGSLASVQETTSGVAPLPNESPAPDPIRRAAITTPARPIRSREYMRTGR